MNLNLKMWIVWHLPRWLIYWATIRLVSEASSSPEHSSKCPDELTAMDALRSWNQK